jgi:group I intron endonuclease
MSDGVAIQPLTWHNYARPNGAGYTIGPLTTSNKAIARMANPNIPRGCFRVIPGNEPLRRAGVYVITHEASGKRYVGISQDVRRRFSHHQTGHSPRVLKLAVADFGWSAFLFEPIYYSLDGRTDHLPQVEADLIASFGTASGAGYNVQAANGSVGPFGEEYTRIMRALWAEPGFRAAKTRTLKTAWADPAVRARHAAASKLAQAEPERRARQSEAIKAVWADPERRRAHSEKMKARHADPAFKARHRIATRNGHPRRVRSPQSELEFN